MYQTHVKMLLLLAAGACDGGSGTQEPGAVVTVLVTAPTTRIEAGQKIQLTATAHDAEGFRLDNVTFEWNSGVTSVATVTQDGLVTGVGKGGSRIRATSDHVTGSLIIRVEPGPRAE